MNEKTLKTPEPNKQQPDEKKPYSAPEIVKIDLNVENWKGYIVSGSADCCHAGVVAG